MEEPRLKNIIHLTCKSTKSGLSKALCSQFKISSRKQIVITARQPQTNRSRQPSKILSAPILIVTLLMRTYLLSARMTSRRWPAADITHWTPRLKYNRRLISPLARMSRSLVLRRGSCLRQSEIETICYLESSGRCSFSGQRTLSKLSGTFS